MIIQELRTKSGELDFQGTHPARLDGALNLESNVQQHICKQRYRSAILVPALSVNAIPLLMNAGEGLRQPSEAQSSTALDIQSDDQASCHAVCRQPSTGVAVNLPPLTDRHDARPPFLEEADPHTSITSNQREKE